ncbi:MAG TPA: AMP-dependent synthetase, partial [Nitrososphaera sp.]|nr:AMP-dependent synthetase [Nitrososphaera sp.]
DGYKAHSNVLPDQITKSIEESIGRFARPQEVRMVTELPKTRTGKLVRRLVKAKIAGGNIDDQDLSTVENPWSLDGI